MMLRFEELIERYHDEIFAYIWRLLGTDGRHDGAMDAEDLVQDVFLRAYQRYPSLRPASNHRAWLYKIATNRTYSKLRQVKRRRARISSMDAALNVGDNPEHCQTRNHRAGNLRGMIAKLPVRQKACVTLRYLQELEYAEIAQILGCSEDNARAHVSQAIRRLRLRLEE